MTPRASSQDVATAPRETARNDSAKPSVFSGALPSIVQPKGGGAIKGIGEKFAANPATGSGTMNVPIALSPGRSGFGPNLSLSYDSSTGNGPFGFGWSLSLPSIARRTAKGVPQYSDETESDVYVMSGAEDLVPILDSDGVRREEHDSAPDHVIHRYRPRVEGLFARMERWTHRVGGAIHWRTITRENITTLYGLTGNSRIVDPNRPDRVFRWLPCQSFDDKGNAMVFDYAAEDDMGIDLALGSERTRVRGAQRYLKSIRYGNRVSRLIDPDPARAEWLFQAVFDYDEGYVAALPSNPCDHSYVRASEHPTRPWPARPDPLSDHRAGFEIRTHRRCHRVLMFHNFVELGPEPCLVRSTEFHYDDAAEPFATIDAELDHAGSTRIASFLCRVTQAGHVRKDDGQYLTATLPPVEFTYSKARIDDTLRRLDDSSAENLPIGVVGQVQWVDLDGDGAPGILTRQGGAGHYKSNLGGGRFGPARAEPTQPAPGKARSGDRFMDLSGDGQLDLVAFDGPLPGFYERGPQGDWQSFKAFSALPRLDWNDPNLRLVDLSGDGFADVLITRPNELVWYRSLGEAGFAPPETVHHDWAGTDGPQLVFADGRGAIFLADMSGDGLSDLVRIGNGEVAYWPSLGHGRFGARVNMDGAPWFDTPDLFDPRRIQLADVDGSGTTDILYLAGDGARFYFNLSGNGWSQARRLKHFPPISSVSTVAAADLLGNGTACLVWSTTLPASVTGPLSYIDLMGGQKPHLLVATRNNMGAETRVHYSPSTRFAFADKVAGRPWITRLPFPVHVVERVETIDHIGRTRFAARYSYHHGHFDGEEREFRGFGMVEQTDTEEYAALTADGKSPAQNIEHYSHVPEVLTRSFFHTGIDIGGEHVSDYFAGLLGQDDQGEYFREPGLDDAAARALLLPDTALPPGLSAEDRREACRALRGSLLRQEIYALDGGPLSDLPHGVTERSYAVKKLQDRGPNPYAVILVSSREEIAYGYERAVVRVRDGAITSDLMAPKACSALDPRVAHTITLETDRYGTPLKTVTIGYGRRHRDPSLPAAVRAAQAEVHVTYGETQMTVAVDRPDDWRTPAPFDQQSYALTGYSPTGPGGRFQPSDFGRTARDGSFMLRADAEVPYESPAAPGRCRRCLSRKVTLYRRDDLTGPLPLGELGALGLGYETYTLALTKGLVATVYGDRLTDEMLASAGYRPLDDAGWWMPSGRVFFSPESDDSPESELAHARATFFLPMRARDPFHRADAPTESRVRYDDYALLAVESVDALGTRITVGERGPGPHDPMTRTGQDYRVLAPALVMDANRNCVAMAFDALGRVAGTAVMGKPEETLGDRLDAVFEATLSPAEIAAFVADPHAAAPRLLQGATSRMVEDVHAFALTRDTKAPQPIVAGSIAREIHQSDLAPGATSPLHVTLAYSDGFGRAIQMKLPAEPGPVPERGADGQIVVGPDHLPVMSGTPAPRSWTGTGWTIFNNKGKPVRSYEPFFTDTHKFEFDLRIGQSPILFYDPMSRIVGTLFPNQTWNKSVFGPWRAEVWDIADTLRLDPATDPDLGDFFARLPTSDYRPGWYAKRIDGALGPLERQAAERSVIAAATPSVIQSDSLGRTILTTLHNRIADSSGDTREEFPDSHTTLDIQGNQREIRDALGRLVMRYDYDLPGSRIGTQSMEAGQRRILIDVTGKPLYAWDDRGHAFRTTYDVLRRPVASYLRSGSAREITLTLSVYGEDLAAPEARNLRGRISEMRDQAGLVTTDAYDFKGNALSSTRRLAADYRDAIDWSLAPALAPERYTSRTRFDALDRPVQMIPPQSGRGGGISVVEPGYNEANLLERLNVWLDRSTAPEGRLTGGPEAPAPVGITGIDYDAKGQRRRVDHANGTVTRYEYDPLTLRLVRLHTDRADKAIQDMRYIYDAMGNVAHIADAAQSDVFFRNTRVTATADYDYDALYRLTRATGREHMGQSGRARPTGPDDGPPMLLQAADGTALGRYTERYAYDIAGNLTRLRHHSAADATGGWTRMFSYDEASLLEPGNPSNRLSRTKTGDIAEEHGRYDAHGNMLALPHLEEIAWNHADQLQMTRRQAGTGAARTWYVYDGAGARVRKVTEDADGRIREERIYLGGFEIYRRHGSDPLTRETLHIMDDKTRIALVETRIAGAEPGKPPRLIRYQLGDHLGHSRIELDEKARLISAEEFSPWRSTTWHAVDSLTQTPKRYRAGQERDDATGLYYHGARYYAPWLCRWISADPIGIADGNNLFRYSRNNPVNIIDPTGKSGEGNPFSLGDIIPYADKVPNKAALGANIQKDHAISQKIIKTILGPFEKLYKPGRDLTTVVETGAASGSTAARWHTVKSTLEKTIQAAVSAKSASGASISLADDVIVPVSNVLKQASNAQKLSRGQYLGMLSQLGNMHVLSLEQTAKLLPILESGDMVKLTTEINKLAGARSGAAATMRVFRGIAETEKAAHIAAVTPGILQKISQVAAPAGRFLGKIAGPLGILIGAGQMATAKNSEEFVDGAITTTSSALMMHPHPVAKAAGGGLFAGQMIDKATGASDVSSDFGVSVKGGLERLGVNEDVAFVAGGVATLAAVPTSIPIGAAKTIHHRLTSDEYTLVPWKSQIWSDIFD